MKDTWLFMIKNMNTFQQMVKKLIKYKKGTTLSVVENMIVAKDAKRQVYNL